MMGYYIRGSCILIRWPFGLDLDDIGIGSGIKRDTLTETINKLI